MSLDTEPAFELTGPLPAGVTVLEASAGTGKTFTIAALTARYVAEGLPLESLLLVTFTRIATGELRERVRERLVSAERELTRVLAGAEVTEGDEVAALLAGGDRETVRLRRDRLTAAVSGFDAATIATTHGFCQAVLAELGTLGDLEPDAIFAEDVEDLIEEVIDDLYVRRFHHAEAAELTRAEAGRVARMAIANPGARLHPRDAAGEGLAAMRARLAKAACDELERRKRALAVMTYDDLLTRLCHTLQGERGAVAAARLRARYRVVLIDEFQDTDPIQWEIVRRAFGEGSVTLVLIADPKQAIYAFRGADVYAYLDAVGGAALQTLSVNRRSDQPLIDGFDALFGHARLGHPRIAYRRVQAAACHRAPRLHGAPSEAALRFRVVDRSQASISLTYNGYASSATARQHIARDLAAEAVALLGSGAMIDQRAESGETTSQVAVRPGDLAVLVQSHRNAALVQEELQDAGVRAVINGAGSVFATGAGQDWLTLLEALERPASPPRARAAARPPAGVGGEGRILTWPIRRFRNPMAPRSRAATS
jgi:exodeoxyribonuclease V beta subunit